MRYRLLGKTGFEVSEIGHGAWGIGGGQWRGHSDGEAIGALHRSIKYGINFIDTALAYGEGGHSEQLVGSVVKEHQMKIFIATKVPPKNRIWPARRGVGIAEVFPRDYIVECTNASLKNLGMESVDLQQLHVWNSEWIDDEGWRRAIEDLKTSGKIRAFGVSINDHQPDSALELIETGLIDTVQVIYNIFDQTPETKLLPLCHQKNIGVIARVPFDEGALTGRINPESVFHPGDFRANYFRGDRLREVDEHIRALAGDLEVEAHALPSIALRFILSNHAVSTVIPGMRSISSVEANAAAPMLGPLPPNTLEIVRRHAWNKNYYD